MTPIELAPECKRVIESGTMTKVCLVRHRRALARARSARYRARKRGADAR